MATREDLTIIDHCIAVLLRRCFWRESLPKVKLTEYEKAVIAECAERLDKIRQRVETRDGERNFDTISSG